MTQFEGLRTPVAGDSDALTSGNAEWLKTLCRIATQRNNQTLPQDPAETGIILKGHGSSIAAWSLIGAIGATYPGSPTVEPSPYMQATLDESDMLLYVKEAYTSSATYIEAFAFQPDKPVRVLVDPTDPDYEANYIPGMNVGRPATTSSLSKDSNGLILVTVPYTQDSGTTYYAWVVAPQALSQRKRVVIIGTLAAPTSATPTVGLAAGFDYDPTTKEVSANDKRYIIFNWDRDLSAEDGTFAKIETCEGLWDCYWAGCSPMYGFTGLPEDPGA